MRLSLRPPLTIFLLTVLAVPAALPVAAHAERVKTQTGLVPTAARPSAHGVARLVLRTPARGGFGVKVQSLDAGATYDVLVGGIKMASLVTDENGEGRVRFGTAKAGPHLVLGFDPRSEAVEVRNAAGDDVLVGNVAAPAGSEQDKACCVPDDQRTKCEDRTPSECAALGGVTSAAGSCLPDPCGSAPPPAADVVCCIPDDSGPDCEDRTAASCLSAGGVVVEADSCLSNPCNATPPPPEDHVQCCVAAYYVWACEDHTVAECEQLKGFNKGPGTCSPNPCGDVRPSTGHGVCCLPNAAGDEIECEDRKAADCVDAGGVVKTDSSACGVDTCADVLPPNPDILCCVQPPLSGEVECEDRTASQCAAEGGVNKGAGVCGLDTCADVVPVEHDVMCCVPGGKDNQLRCEDRTLERCLADGGTSLGEGSCPAVDPCVAGN